MAAFAPAAMKRAAIFADGWMPVGVPPDQLTSMGNQVKEMVKSVGRDPASFKILARYNIDCRPQPLGKDRSFASGSLEQIRQDLHAAIAAGPDELIIDPSFSGDSQNEEGFLRKLDQLKP